MVVCTNKWPWDGGVLLLADQTNWSDVTDHATVLLSMIPTRFVLILYSGRLVLILPL